MVSLPEFTVGCHGDCTPIFRHDVQNTEVMIGHRPFVQAEGEVPTVCFHEIEEPFLQ